MDYEDFIRRKPWFLLIGLAFIATLIISGLLWAAEADGMTVATVGVLLGVVYKTSLPFYDKLIAGKIQSFNIWYLVTALASFVLALFTVPEIVQSFALTIDPLWSTMVTLFNAMIFAAIYNGTMNYLFVDKH